MTDIEHLLRSGSMDEEALIKALIKYSERYHRVTHYVKPEQYEQLVIERLCWNEQRLLTALSGHLNDLMHKPLRRDQIRQTCSQYHELYLILQVNWPDAITSNHVLMCPERLYRVVFDGWTK